MRIQKSTAMNLKKYRNLNSKIRKLENQVAKYEIKAIQAIYGIKINKSKIYKLG